VGAERAVCRCVDAQRPSALSRPKRATLTTMTPGEAHSVLLFEEPDADRRVMPIAPSA
jgi:hypothetical protein